MKISRHSQKQHGGLCVFMIIAFSVLFWAAGSPGTAFSQDADNLAKEADKIIRSAERDMFGGKKEQADQKLNEAAQLIEKLKASDPEHKKLKSIESKYAKVRRDLDKRMKKSTTGSGKVVKPAPPPKAKKTTPGAGSSEAKRQQGVIDRAVKKTVKDVDYALKKIDKVMSPDGSVRGMPKPVDKKIADAKRYLEEAEGYLVKTEEKYGEKLPSPNPDFDNARAKIAEAGKKVEKWAQELAAKAGQEAEAEATAKAGAQKTLEKATKDANSMIALNEKYYSRIESMRGKNLVYGLKLEDAQKALEKIEQAEKLFPEFSSELGSLADTYGSNSMEISNKLFDMGYKATGDPGGKLAQLIEASGKVIETRKESAATVARNAETLLGAFSGQLTDARMKRMNDAKALLVVGQKLDPGSTTVRDMLTKIDDQIVEAADKMEKQINAKTWAGNIKNFKGPGDADDLAEKALDYFRNDRDWGKNPKKKNEVLAVCVRGPWKVAERDVFGRVIQWRLPIHVAVTDEKLKQRNIARVYELSIVAMEGAPDKAPKEPPYDGYWVGNSWMMRLDKF